MPGTTRSFVIDVARKAGMTVHEGLYFKVAVEGADEVFVTNAIQELVPLSSIGEKQLQGATGVYYKKLHHLYCEAIVHMKEGGD